MRVLACPRLLCIAWKCGFFPDQAAKVAIDGSGTCECAAIESCHSHKWCEPKNFLVALSPSRNFQGIFQPNILIQGKIQVTILFANGPGAW